jgi:hypothetical protein
MKHELRKIRHHKNNETKVFKIFEPLLINSNKSDLHKTSQCTQVTICFREVLALYLKGHHKQKINPFLLEAHYICNLQCPKFPGFLLPPTQVGAKYAVWILDQTNPLVLRHLTSSADSQAESTFTAPSSSLLSSSSSSSVSWPLPFGATLLL